MLRKAIIIFIGLALLWTTVVGVVSASPNQQTELTPFELLMAVLSEAYYEDALSDELSQTLADHFMNELIPSVTGETAEEVRERLKARFYPGHEPDHFEILVAALSGADESGALTDEISGLLYDYLVDELIPSETGDTPEDVRERLSDPVRIREKVADFYVMRGLRYHENDHFDLAIADHTRAIEVAPEHLPAYVERAFAYRERGDLDHAIADFTRAIELDPIEGWLRYHRGIMYRDRGDYDLAIADFDKAIEVNPNWVPHYSGARRRLPVQRRLRTGERGLLPCRPTQTGTQRLLHRARGGGLYQGYRAKPPQRRTIPPEGHLPSGDRPVRQRHRRLHQGHITRPRQRRLLLRQSADVLQSRRE